MSHDETAKDRESAEKTTPSTYQQLRDEIAGIKVGPPGTGPRDQDAIDKGDERWEQARGSH
jgi:hypothetical protein